VKGLSVYQILENEALRQIPVSGIQKLKRCAEKSVNTLRIRKGIASFLHHPHNA